MVLDPHAYDPPPPPDGDGDPRNAWVARLPVYRTARASLLRRVRLVLGVTLAALAVLPTLINEGTVAPTLAIPLNLGLWGVAGGVALAWQRPRLFAWWTWGIWSFCAVVLGVAVLAPVDGAVAWPGIAALAVTLILAAITGRIARRMHQLAANPPRAAFPAVTVLPPDPGASEPRGVTEEREASLKRACRLVERQERLAHRHLRGRRVLGGVTAGLIAWFLAAHPHGLVGVPDEFSMTALASLTRFDAAWLLAGIAVLIQVAWPRASVTLMGMGFLAFAVGQALPTLLPAGVVTQAVVSVSVAQTGLLLALGGGAVALLCVHAVVGTRLWLQREGWLPAPLVLHLIAGLDSDEAAVRERVHTFLHTHTGEAFAADSGPWRRWCEDVMERDARPPTWRFQAPWQHDLPRE